DSRREAALRFVNNFKSLYNAEPGIIEAQAYDAVKMMMEAVKKSRQPEVRSLPPDVSIGGQREEVRANLANLKDFPGATGNIAFDSNREAVKNLFMLEVKNGKIVEIN
ncbi:MAG: ABC transporter substrate-binding protein, partial [Deltaproteobacteria bacterium]|nr:ABC transporter substrate-binding protein [Deltaproteobacteria bacterium]